MTVIISMIVTSAIGLFMLLVGMVILGYSIVEEAEASIPKNSGYWSSTSTASQFKTSAAKMLAVACVMFGVFVASLAAFFITNGGL